MSKAAISVQNVGKSFLLPHEKYAGLKQAVIHFRPGRKYETQTVLKNISFDIQKGEFFGIVGRNGSGKSTLLKLLAQIYTPNRGGVQVNGSLTPFIELGVGFNPELTGRENVYLNGALLGFDRAQMNAMYDDIVEFAELQPFMDQKLKNYSSGMQVRLAFSIAIRAQSDILLIDEVLAVGDSAFQLKCFNYFENLKREKRTIVFVSHDMTAVKQFCDKVLLLDKGEITMIGSPLDVALEYERLNYYDETAALESPEAASDTGVSVAAYNHKHRKTTKFEYGTPITLEATWPAHLEVGIIGFSLFKGSECIFATNSIDQGLKLDQPAASLVLNQHYGNGRYRVNVGLFGQSRHDLIAHVPGPEILIFNQPLKGEHREEWEGLFYTDNQWVQ